jgi:hypothetical protein
VQINGNDHYITDSVVWQYTRLGVQVNGAGNLISGVHVWGCGDAWCDPDWYNDPPPLQPTSAVLAIANPIFRTCPYRMCIVWVRQLPVWVEIMESQKCRTVGK